MAGPMRGDEIPDIKPPRPPNSWILYRADCLKRLPPVAANKPRRSQADVSQMISTMWKAEPEGVRAEYERMADEAKAAHKRQFPNYRYQPKKKEEKERIKSLQKHHKELQKQAKKTRRAGQGSSKGARSVKSIPQPGVPYYVRPMHHIPALHYLPGPSPPLSLASSPIDVADSPSPAPPSFPNHATSSSFSPQSLEQARISLPMPSSSQSLVQILHAAFSGMNNNHWHSGVSALQQEAPQQVEDTFLPSSSEQWDHSVSNQQTQDSTAAFDIPLETYHNVQEWCNANDQQQLDRMFAQQNFDADIFQLQSQQAPEDAEGEVEVVVGNDLNTIFDQPLGMQQQLLSNDSSVYDQNYIPTDEEYNMLLNMNQYLNDSISLPADISAESSSQGASFASYTPPSGAALSSLRRVGGNWADLMPTQDLLAPSA